MSTVPAPFRTADGLALHLHDWPVTHPRARLLLVHGLGEHGGRYARLAGELNAAGFAIRSYDQRGHGRCLGKRGVIGRDPDALARDAVEVFSAYAREADDVPFLFGHSLGGLVVMHAVLAQGLRPRGLITSSPALASHASTLERGLAAAIAPLLPRLTLRNGLPTDRLSHDPDVELAYLSDPLNHDRISAALARFIFTRGPQAIAHATALSLPMLLQFAGDDALVDARGARAFDAAAPIRYLTAREYPALYHEIHNEALPARSEVFADLLRWLEQQLP